MKYFFALGNTPELSLLELKSVFPDVNFESVSQTWQVADMTDGFSAQEAMGILGGITKIAKFIKQWPVGTNVEEVKQFLADYLISQVSNNKLLYAFAQNQPVFELSATDFKPLLKEQQIKSRYLDSTSQGAKAVLCLNKPDLLDLILVHADQEIYLLQTVAVQDIDDWTKRDRQKPYANRLKGMLPPKVARMMVNIALTGFEADYKPKLLDPFCGTGTILMEGAMRGCVVYGADLDYQAVLGSIKNLDWLIAEYNLKKNHHLVRRDVSQLQESDFPEKIDLVVSEPYLGKQTPQLSKLPNIFKGLEKLYLGAFNNWTKLLANRAKVVLIFPKVEVSGRIYTLNNLIDKLASKGYTLQVKPLVYARQKAIVQREIYIFEYQKG